MKVKLEEIAQKAQVSTAAVSMALNNKKGVSEETRRKILSIAEEMGYEYKIEAVCEDTEDKTEHKCLKFIAFKKHSLVVEDTAFFAKLIEGIEKESRKSGYELIVSNINYNSVETNSLMDSLRGEHVQGILILGTELEEKDIGTFKNLDKPVVILDTYFENECLDYILIDNFRAAHQAVGHLVENGHKQIGHLRSSNWIHNFEERELGFRKAMRKFNLPIESNNIISLRPTLEGAYIDMKEYLQRSKSLPTAFFADNDIIAFGAIKALQEKGIRIPEEISIVGMDDMPFCEYITPALTTVKVFNQDIGKVAVKRVIEKINEKDKFCEKIALGTELVIRASVSCRDDGSI